MKSLRCAWHWAAKPQSWSALFTDVDLARIAIGNVFMLPYTPRLGFHMRHLPRLEAYCNPPIELLQEQPHQGARPSLAASANAGVSLFRRCNQSASKEYLTFRDR